MSVSVQGQMGPSKIWELSFYDLQRSPQEAITDHTEIAVSPRSLQSELMCPICLDMLKKTMTTKECLHRFCSDCIITALRSGNKECPTCRKKLVSKRSLRPDPNFDLLINKIYPGREEHDSRQKQAVRDSQISAPFGNSLTEGPGSSKVKLSFPSGSFPASPSSTESYDPNETELIFKPHPTEMLADPLMKRLNDSLRYIKTPEKATIDHLSKYLAMRLTLDNIDSEQSDNLGLVNFCVYIASSPGHLILLSGDLTLQQVKEKYWKSDKPVEMYYSINKKT